MRHFTKILMRCSIATIVGLVALSWSGDVGLNGPSTFVSSAEARIGRPATPMSYAVGGKQFVLICAGGHGKMKTKRGDSVVAFALAGT